MRLIFRLLLYADNYAVFMAQKTQMMFFENIYKSKTGTIMQIQKRFIICCVQTQTCLEFSDQCCRLRHPGALVPWFPLTECLVNLEKTKSPTICSRFSGIPNQQRSTFRSCKLYCATKLKQITKGHKQITNIDL